MLSLRGLTDHTVTSYSTYISTYLNYLESINCSPTEVSWQTMRDFIKWLETERSLADRTINAVISQLRFFHIYVLHKEWDPSQLPYRRFDTYLPYVPDQETVWKFISTIKDLRFKAIAALMYSAGLRSGEVRNLKVSDISSTSMRIHIRHAKNRNDRYAPLSQRTLKILNEYWKPAADPWTGFFR